MWLDLATLPASEDHQTAWDRMLSRIGDIQLTAGHAVVFPQGLQHKLVTVHHRCCSELIYAYLTPRCNTALEGGGGGRMVGAHGCNWVVYDTIEACMIQ